jgi:hypothetical protein
MENGQESPHTSTLAVSKDNLMPIEWRLLADGLGSALSIPGRSRGKAGFPLADAEKSPFAGLKLGQAG